MSSRKWARTQQPNTPETVIDIVLELDKLASQVMASRPRDNAVDPTRVTADLYITRSILMIAAALEKIAITLAEHPGMVTKDGIKSTGENLTV